MKGTKPSAPRETPSRQLAGFLAKFDPAIARLVRAGRGALRKRFPTATELVYDNYNALAIGFGSTEGASDAIVSLAVYPRGVSLYFLHGARLPDPAHVLQGAGKQGRFIRFENPSLFERPEVEALITAATAVAKTPLPATGRGQMVIKSISAKQRARRPGT